MRRAAPLTFLSGISPTCLVPRQGYGTYTSRFRPRTWSACPERRPVQRRLFACAVPKDELLRRAEAGGVPRDVADRVFSKANAALRDWTCVLTEFLTPPDSAALEGALREVANIRVEAWGGYSSAERTVLVVARSEMTVTTEAGRLHTLVPDDLVCLEIRGNFLFDIATHRDFMGAVLGTGITRQKVGDIVVVGDRGAQVIVSSDVAEFLPGALTSVRTVSVTVEPIPWEKLQVRPPSVKEMTVVEASLRLDAVASAGFSMSRTKINQLVKSGDCQKNYKTVTQPSKNLASGDVVSIRGRGKLVIGETSITAKGRHRVNVKRFV